MGDVRNAPLLSFNAQSLPSWVANEATLHDPVELRKRPSMFGRGSMWGTVFNTCAATLGAGALSLPHAMAGMGLIPGSLLLVIIGLATHYSIVLIVAAIGATNAPSFEELSQMVFGRRTRLAVELSIIMFCFGSCIAYSIAVGDILEPLLALPWMQARLPWVGRDDVMVFFWLVFMLPLSFVERMTSLQWTSLFGVLALLYLVVAVSIHSAVDCAADPHNTIGRVKLANPSADAISAMSIIMFAFTCQVNIPSLYAELHNQTPHQMSRVSVRAVTLSLLSYLAIGFAGYANFADATQGNILNNYCVLHPAQSARTSQSPHVIAPAFIAITLTILMAYPVNLFPCRYSLTMLLFSNTSRCTPRFRLVRHVGLTLGIAGLALVVALKVPNISVVFQLMGGTASAYVCYCIPAATAWRLRDQIPEMQSQLGRGACVALFLTGLLVGILSTVVTLVELFGDHDSMPYDACNATASHLNVSDASTHTQTGPYLTLRLAGW